MSILKIYYLQNKMSSTVLTIKVYFVDISVYILQSFDFIFCICLTSRQSLRRYRQFNLVFYFHWFSNFFLCSKRTLYGYIYNIEIYFCDVVETNDDSKIRRCFLTFLYYYSVLLISVLFKHSIQASNFNWLISNIKRSVLSLTS